MSAEKAMCLASSCRRKTSKRTCSRYLLHIQQKYPLNKDTQDVPGGMYKIREGVPYGKLYRYNPKHLYPKLNGYGDNGQRSLKL